MNKDTICSISTPIGAGGIGLVRLSGKDTMNILDNIFRSYRGKKILDMASHTVHYGHVFDGTNIVDEVLVTVMKKPATYTREDMAEIGCHGGIMPLKSTLKLCIKNGARMAEPGEFTRRAFLNGRIDLAQAESVLEVIASKTEESLAMAVKKLKGSLSSEIENIRTALVRLLTSIEAKINFPDEQDVIDYEPDIFNETMKIKQRVEGILSKAGKGKVMCRGINAAIIGRTNVGKSSLLNAFLREDRAIVTPVPGTTRDTVQEIINVRGIPVNIIDTAGIRKETGEIERMGIKKSMEWIDKAEIILLVIDASRKLNEYDKKLLSVLHKKGYIVILNKVDMPLKVSILELGDKVNMERIVEISAKNGKGIDELEERLYNLIIEGLGEVDGSELYLNIRQENLFSELKAVLDDALFEIKSGGGLEVVSEQVNFAACKTDSLLGKDVNKEVMDEIFERFCIGK